MKFSFNTLFAVTLWSSLSFMGVNADEGLFDGDKIGWEYFSDAEIDPWYLPGSATSSSSGKEGSVDVGENRLRCGIVPYDEHGNIWMVAAKKDFEDVGFILPKGGYDDTKDSDFWDCVKREGMEEGGLVIYFDDMTPLGMTDKRSVYWFKAIVRETSGTGESRPALPRTFNVANAREELKKPRDNHKKKASMRRALWETT